MGIFGRAFFVFRLAISAFALLAFMACSAPLGFPADFRVYSNDNYSGLLQDGNYSKAVSVTGIHAIIKL